MQIMGMITKKKDPEVCVTNIGIATLRSKLVIIISSVFFATGCVADPGSTTHHTLNLKSGAVLDIDVGDSALNVSLVDGGSQLEVTLPDSQTGTLWLTQDSIALLEDNQNRPSGELASMFVVQNLSSTDGSIAIQEYSIMDLGGHLDLVKERLFDVPVRRPNSASKLRIDSRALKMTLYVTGAAGNEKDRTVLEYDISASGELKPSRIMRARK